MPATARASVLGDFVASIKKNVFPARTSFDAGAVAGSLQTMDLLTPAMNLNPAPATGGGDVVIIDDSALVPAEGPSGTIADIEKPKNATITTYIVQPGDTVSGIAKMFDVTSGTIRVANDMENDSKLRVGQKLVILPITSISYTVRKGDTLESIAKRYGSDVTEITSYNGVDNATLAVGSTIIIPNGEAPVAARSSTQSRSTGTSGGSRTSGTSGVFAHNPKEPAHDVGAPGTTAEIAYYIAPLSSYVKTQKIHGYNAVDFGAPSGTPIMAAASGDVVVAREGGWNGGYGSYVVISHSNGSQTLYSHMSDVATYDGAHVVQGQVIGYVGRTGMSTGPHLHFEIRNGIQNPF